MNDENPFGMEPAKSQAELFGADDAAIAAVEAALSEIAATARGEGNLLVPMKVALGAMATLGEVADVLRDEFGVYQPGG